MSDWKEFLEINYFDPSKPGSFAGPKKVYQILKENGYNANLRNLKSWLQDQDAYSLLRQRQYKFNRERIVTVGIDDLWDADLADVRNIHEQNKPYKYWLVVIDVFSRFLWIVPVASKHHTHMVQAFRTIFRSTPRRPKHLRTDKGTEFTNRAVKKLMKAEGINAYTTRNETKANYAERVIKTMKGLVYRYFLHNQTHVYVDILSKLVDNYNNRPHRSLEDMAPVDVTPQNEARVWKRMYVDTVKKTPRTKFKYRVGDTVRISHLKYTFAREFHERWTEEIFIVSRRLRRGGYKLYELKDYGEEPINGYFYEVELQSVRKDLQTSFRKIEKVLKQRRRAGQMEYLVKWMGWPKKFNSWVQQTDIKTFK